VSAPKQTAFTRRSKGGAWVNSVYRERTNGTANCNKLIYN